MSVEENIKARGDAMQMIDLCGEQPSRFWEVLARMAADRCDKAIGVLPKAIVDGHSENKMNATEAQEFERVTVPFGKYAGQCVGDVPMSYWLWVTESDWNRDLIRYLRSDTFQQRQE